ncbi:MAG TPA: 16S rRNA (adenine(1518)-N(6)/adenine(1519)-N(6))-dimethyltransferase RsmA [Miltoncostaeaceae bacterium]|nr:16S rRNA (adenine(1518)-N(6)/adenine(1519)-N(6))-dimethyltransferase RsmA [Miltoncostaeaceae bacterium]
MSSEAEGPPRAGTRRLLAEHGVRPDTDLGQHFLLDENLADLAVRRGRVGPDDVVLEVGPGLGTLTAGLARSAACVHAIEIDERLRPALESVLEGHDNVRLRFADAMRVDLAALDPAPTRVVANLPYSIATPLVLETLWQLPGVGAWCVMVQREVADRWLAPPGSRLYGAPSVLLQLAARQTFLRAVGPQAFIPRPRVESALVALERVAPGPGPAVRSLVHAAFATRRKTLVNALSAAGRDREQVARALDALGMPPAVRAEALPPAAFPELARELSWTA